MGRYVREVLPDYAASLLEALREEGREDLANQVDSLQIVALCEFGHRESESRQRVAIDLAIRAAINVDRIAVTAYPA